MKKRPKIATGLGFCLPVLIAVPVVAWLTGWHWQAEAQSPQLGFFYLLTQTVSNPVGVFTAVVLLAALLWVLKPGKAHRWKCALLIMAPIALGQVAVSVLKRVVQEPRPYVMWLNHDQPQAVAQFYSEEPAKRGMTVLNTLHDNHAIPSWQQDHWAKESTWSFPSGHSIFAAAWALLGVGVLWPRKRFLAAFILTAWAAGVLVSRLFLGMHWPVDLLASIGLAFILTRPSVVAINRSLPPPGDNIL